MSNTTLVLIYLAPVSLFYNDTFIYDLLFIHPEATTGFVEKTFFEFLKYSSISISKNSGNENFAKLPEKASILVSLFQVHLQAFSVCKKPFASGGSSPF